LQFVVLKVPDEAGLSWNVTVAVGVIFVPPLVSVIVAVQVATWLSSTSVELQLMVVDVDLSTAWRLNVLELPLWSVSPP
jgi:hypothetical protein